MALSGIEWSRKAVFDTELRNLQSNKSKENRTPEEQAVVDYFKVIVKQLNDKKDNKE